ncbi:hypothetical protein CRUP_022446 [Coryphaenoides rupestris]|nr:hypothetical protein CRUP_022446 [Coryphaenoides rupestris]
MMWRRTCYRYVLCCFEVVARDSEEFLDLPPEELMGILGEDGLNAPREEAVFEAVLRLRTVSALRFLRTDEAEEDPAPSTLSANGTERSLGRPAQWKETPRLT